MRQIAYCFIAIILMASCRYGDTGNKAAPVTQDTVEAKAASLPTSKGKGERKTVHDIAVDGKYIRWVCQHPNSPQYLCELFFHEEYVAYFYHGQCTYDYFTYITSDTTIDMIWSYKTDCILDMDFLEQSHGVKKRPQPREQFAIYALINDSTLQVTYQYPEWVMKVNAIAKDSLFPNYFYLVDEK